MAAFFGLSDDIMAAFSNNRLVGIRIGLKTG